MAGEITHVSDTALMVAACRALESERSDAFINDPFAGRLAGERGMAMLRAVPNPGFMQFGIAVRVRFLEELLREALSAEPIPTVLSVGCGLDTRPWRLDLPPELRWIEIDFPEMLDYKDALMAAEKPRCRRERLTADVNDPVQRRAIYAAAGSGPALMITEGLLVYLPGATVEAIAEESRRESSITHWISDITTDAFVKAVGLDHMRVIGHVRAADSLSGEQTFDCILRHGWKSAAQRSYLTDMAFASDRIRQMFGDPPQPSGPAPVPADPTGLHRFTRQ
jgi:methyltransferase (TIGR00027 family)